MLFKKISFRCSLINFDGKPVVPWSLSPTTFRYLQWTDAGDAEFDESSSEQFWAMAFGEEDPADLDMVRSLPPLCVCCCPAPVTPP